MVSPKTAQPDNNLAGSSVGNVNLIKPSSTKLKPSESETNGLITIPASPREPLNINEENEKISQENEPPKKIIPSPAPIPAINIWQLRKEAMNAKKVTETSNLNDKDAAATITVTTTDIKKSENLNIDQQEPPDDFKRFAKKDSKKQKQPPILPPLEDQTSWPAPAEVLIKDKEKEQTDSSEKKQSNDIGTKDNQKRGKGKWIKYTPIITHNTPLPSHERSKPRRRSEDHVGLRERKSSEKVINPEVETPTVQSNNTTRRRASVPPPSREYGRRYSQHGENGINHHHHSNSGPPFRGGRRGRGRPYNGTRGPPRSVTLPYASTGYVQQYVNVYGTKIGYDLEILKFYILQQIEYYFSIDNLCKDIFLRNNMDPEGYVPIALLAGFNRVKALTMDLDLVREALLNSRIVEINEDKVRKREGWESWLLPKQYEKGENELEHTNNVQTMSKPTGYQHYEVNSNEGIPLMDDDENKENEEMPTIPE